MRNNKPKEKEPVKRTLWKDEKMKLDSLSRILWLLTKKSSIAYEKIFDSLRKILDTFLSFFYFIIVSFPFFSFSSFRIFSRVFLFLNFSFLYH